MICMTCKNQEVVWRDFASGDKYSSPISIELCITCLGKHMPEEIKFLKACSKCKQLFQKKFDFQDKCFKCFWRFKK